MFDRYATQSKAWEKLSLRAIWRHDGLKLNSARRKRETQRSHIPDAGWISASAFTRVFDALGAVHRRPRQKNRENNPCKAE
jgi:hypothetical protein